MKRFGFGSNWVSFARHALNADRVVQARAAFEKLLEGIELKGRTFLDIGFGQGLTAALAAEAGAKVTAVDIDPECGTAYEATRAFFRAAVEPEILIGSILDAGVVSALGAKGPFDVVHSWGVLHHTGAMWRAMQNAASLVRPGGHLVIAIYARHWTAPAWKAVKWAYVHSPGPARRLMIAGFHPLMRLRARQLGEDRTVARGMEFGHDLVDWVGGYPYEYASREEIESCLVTRGFVPVRFHPTAGMTGCHEYVFRRGEA